MPAIYEIKRLRLLILKNTMEQCKQRKFNYQEEQIKESHKQWEKVTQNHIHSMVHLYKITKPGKTSNVC